MGGDASSRSSRSDRSSTHMVNLLSPELLSVCSGLSLLLLRVIVILSLTALMSDLIATLCLRFLPQLTALPALLRLLTVPAAAIIFVVPLWAEFQALCLQLWSP